MEAKKRLCDTKWSAVYLDVEVWTLLALDSGGEGRSRQACGVESGVQRSPSRAILGQAVGTYSQLTVGDSCEMLELESYHPIEVNSLFVSYSHKDTPFVEKLESFFDKRDIRYWRDVHDMKVGRIETQIDRAIRLNPTVLLVLSENSVESDWVEWEVAKARELEKKLGRDVLCPVALDETWKTCTWPGPLRRQIEDFHVLDFSGWRDAAAFERQVEKLLDGLQLFFRPKRP